MTGVGRLLLAIGAYPPRPLRNGLAGSGLTIRPPPAVRALGTVLLAHFLNALPRFAFLTHASFTSLPPSGFPSLLFC